MKMAPFAAGGSEIKGRPTARDLVAGELRQAIVRGELRPGTRLAPNELTERFGVSQTPAREAIQLLVSEGLLRNDSFRGSYVSELTADEYEELYLMRYGIEALASRLGAELITDEGLERMETLLKEMEKAAAAEDVDQFCECDRMFHHVHYSATRRESLIRRTADLRVASERYARIAYGMPRVGMLDTLRNHRQLLETARAHDGAACEEVIKEDLRRTLEAFVQQFKERENPASTSR
jgi:GntR family transcriptional regulator, rspAB operon transcriptional repressor